MYFIIGLAILTLEGAVAGIEGATIQLDKSRFKNRAQSLTDRKSPLTHKFSVDLDKMWEMEREC